MLDTYVGHSCFVTLGISVTIKQEQAPCPVPHPDLLCVLMGTVSNQRQEEVLDIFAVPALKRGVRSCVEASVNQTIEEVKLGNVSLMTVYSQKYQNDEIFLGKR